MNLKVIRYDSEPLLEYRPAIYNLPAMVLLMSRISTARVKGSSGSTTLVSGGQLESTLAYATPR